MTSPISQRIAATIARQLDLNKQHAQPAQPANPQQHHEQQENSRANFAFWLEGHVEGALEVKAQLRSKTELLLVCGVPRHGSSCFLSDSRGTFLLEDSLVCWLTCCCMYSLHTVVEFFVRRPQSFQADLETCKGLLLLFVQLGSQRVENLLVGNNSRNFTQSLG